MIIIDPSNSLQYLEIEQYDCGVSELVSPLITLRNGIVVLSDRIRHLNHTSESPLPLTLEMDVAGGELRYLTLRLDKIIAIVEWRPECSEYAVSLLRGEVCVDETFRDISQACERLLTVLREQTIKKPSSLISLKRELREKATQKPAIA